MRNVIFALLTLVSGTLVAELSIEDKVGQLFFGFINTEALDEEDIEFLKRSHLGNIIYYRWANGLHSPDQVRHLSKQLHQEIHANTGMIPLIAVDQEGGAVNRLTAGFSVLPSAEVLGRLNDPAKLYALAHVAATELRAVGINMNLAPVVDVNSNPLNPVIGSRSYGSDPEIVCRMAESFIKAHHDAGVAVVLKHFPGHGDTNVNSHYGLPVIDKSFEDLEMMELVPFRKLTPIADAVMTGHLLVPALDAENPATCSSLILDGLLRRKCHYQGLIISDSLNMRGIVPNQATFHEVVIGVAEAAIRSFEAGCDMLIVGRLDWADFISTPQQDRALLEQVLARFCDAVRTRRISQERLDASLERINYIKLSKLARSLQII